MSQRTLLLILSFIVIMGVALIVVLGDKHNPLTGRPKETYKPGLFPDADKAVNQAYKLYQEKQKLGEDFSKGPCLTNDLFQGWVVDIAHNPRQPVDDLPENQCQAFREGRAKHFVELDPEGNIIRAL